MRVVVMGVAGSGKTTVGAALAERLVVPYADADEFHTPVNVAKMASGQPLTDEDRWPWLEAIARWLSAHPDGAVVTCSALRRSYRDVLRRGGDDVCFLYLDGSMELMSERVAARTEHFMPAELVASQFATLEPPGADERSITVDAALPPGAILDAFVKGTHI